MVSCKHVRARQHIKRKDGALCQLPRAWPGQPRSVISIELAEMSEKMSPTSSDPLHANWTPQPDAEDRCLPSSVILHKLDRRDSRRSEPSPMDYAKIEVSNDGGEAGAVEADT